MSEFRFVYVEHSVTSDRKNIIFVEKVRVTSFIYTIVLLQLQRLNI